MTASMNSFEYKMHFDGVYPSNGGPTHYNGMINIVMNNGKVTINAWKRERDEHGAPNPAKDQNVNTSFLWADARSYNAQFTALGAADVVGNATYYATYWLGLPKWLVHIVDNAVPIATTESNNLRA